MYPNNSEYVWKWREKPYRDVLRALKIMEHVKDSWPRAKNLTVAYLLFSRKMKFLVEEQLEEFEAQNFMAIAETMTKISEDEVEVFWISKEIADLLARMTSDDVIVDLIQMFHKKLANNASTSKLYRY